jgi:RNA polymerase sigma factor (sigma-70 family)
MDAPGAIIHTGPEVRRMTVADREREERFDALFKQYLPDMVAYCGWRALSPADAQDAVAEVFLAVWRRLEEVPAGREARLWLYGTARRVLANQARAGKRRERLTARVVAAQDPSEAVTGGPASDGSVVEAVHTALAQLSPVERVAITVTVGADGLIRRLTLDWVLDVPGEARDWSYTTTYRELGAAPAITAPAASHTSTTDTRFPETTPGPM